MNPVPSPQVPSPISSTAAGVLWWMPSEGRYHGLDVRTRAIHDSLRHNWRIQLRRHQKKLLSSLTAIWSSILAEWIIMARSLAKTFIIFLPSCSGWVFDSVQFIISNVVVPSSLCESIQHGKSFKNSYFRCLLRQFNYQGIAWIAGYIQGDFTVTFYGWLVGLGISLVVIEFLFSVSFTISSVIHSLCLHYQKLSPNSCNLFLTRTSIAFWNVSFAFQIGRCSIEIQ